MPRLDVAALQKEYNSLCVLKGAGLSLLALVAWLFSFGLVSAVPSPL